MVRKNPVTPPAAQRIAKKAVVTSVSAEAVSHRAYALFQARGRQHGHDVEDWLAAETELLSGNNTEMGSPFAESRRRVG